MLGDHAARTSARSRRPNVIAGGSRGLSPSWTKHLQAAPLFLALGHEACSWRLWLSPILALCLRAFACISALVAAWRTTVAALAATCLPYIRYVRVGARRAAVVMPCRRLFFSRAADKACCRGLRRRSAPTRFARSRGRRKRAKRGLIPSRRSLVAPRCKSHTVCCPEGTE